MHDYIQGWNGGEFKVTAWFWMQMRILFLETEQRKKAKCGYWCVSGMGKG